MHNWPVKLYAYAFLSNHFHLEIQGLSEHVSKFVGFVEREISRRIGVAFNLPGTLFHRRFTCTALPTLQSQLECFRYIMSQSVKEDLTQTPLLWPGIHAAKQVVEGKPLAGSWFDGTAFGKAKHKGKHPNKRDYWRNYEVVLTPLPIWQDLDDEQRRTRARDMIDDIVETARRRRRAQGKRVLGVQAILRQPRTQKRVPPSPPWFEKRRACICAWSNPRRRETRELVAHYYAFQRAFREASQRLQNGEAGVVFPAGSWKPALYYSGPSEPSQFAA
jgi:hypothetical protein